MQCLFHIWSPYKTKYGNNFVATSSYDDVRRWVAQRQLQDINGNYLQNINYEYDGVGNITRVTQSALTYGNNLGGEYVVDYTYDDQYRLLDIRQQSGSLGGYFYSMGYSPSGLVGTKLNPELGADMTFGYRYEGETPLSHQPKMIYFPSYYEDITLLGWNANGQMTSMLQPYQDRFRRHWWDETGQLAAAIGNEYCGYYGYNANGERVYKLTGTVYADQYNAGDINIETYLDDMVLYVNPYMVITPRGYTKHYYNGSQRIAARLGEQWVDCGITVDEQDRTSLAREVLEDRMNSTEVEEESLGQEWCRSIYGEEFSPESYMLRTNYMNCNYNEDMLWDVIFYGTQYSDYMGGIARGIFYYHPDHLGSATWITDDQGQAVQYLHYMPFGELWENQQLSEYEERFKFTGKERDTETGYDYFGARYYASTLPMWLSVDPLANEYPNISPYAYCAWNPMKYVDPDGKEKVSLLAISENTSQNLITAYQNYPDYPNILAIWGHGSSQSNDMAAGAQAILHEGKAKSRIETAKGFNDFLMNVSPLWQDHYTGDFAVIVLHSCNTGKGEESFAQRMSAYSSFENVLIIAPNSDVTIIDKKEVGVFRTKVIDGKLIKGDAGQWNYYFNGKLVYQQRGDEQPIHDIQELKKICNYE